VEKESYFARGSAKVAASRSISSPFTIEVRFVGGLTERQKGAFKAAADRWSRVIVGDLPSVRLDGELIDDVLILAEGAPIDGVGHILGQAGPTHLRPGRAGAAAFLPCKGSMTFDTADLANMEQNGTLDDVIAHEMGHVIGIGTVWQRKTLLEGIGSNNPVFVGRAAMREYAALRGLGAATPVPVENSGGAGTRDSHWRENLFRNELMSGFIAAANNPLSRMTVGSLEDLGYTVDYDAAEAYVLPNLAELAARRLLVTHASAPHPEGTVFPSIPTVVPDDSVLL
jgi:hypothetical protein